jgi:MFS superfamily sulfate permease-like transporter
MSARQEKIGSDRLRMPLFHGILPLERSRIWADLVAGVTLAAVGIPEVMGYTKIIETPVITWLYTMFAYPGLRYIRIVAASCSRG